MVLQVNAEVDSSEGRAPPEAIAPANELWAAPRIAADLAGMGGQLRSEPEDFQVVELPAYPACGEGEHLFVRVQKTELSTPEVAQLLAKTLRIAEREVSYAGLKDRRAIACQLFCVPSRVEALVPRIEIPGVQILEMKRHRNKLRTGHLAGNRFRIRVRNLVDEGPGRAVLDRLRTTGLPNYFGPQRFGATGENAAAGKALLHGGASPSRPTGEASRPRRDTDRFRRKLYLSAFQSLLFNRALAARIREGMFGRALNGDVMRRLDSGGLFLCEDARVDQARLDRFEISAAGPLFGPKMMPARGEVARAEEELLAAEGIPLSAFRRGGGESEGSRRAYRLPLPDVALSACEGGAWLEFELPKGSYATALLRELMGGDPR
jgi:tRNA pseudouridine13 synthase